MIPEHQCIVVSRIVPYAPGDEILKRGSIAHIDLTQVLDESGVYGQGVGVLRHVVTSAAGPVAVAVIVAINPVKLDHNVDLRTRTDLLQLIYIEYCPLLEVVIAVQIHQEGPRPRGQWCADKVYIRSIACALIYRHVSA